MFKKISGSFTEGIIFVGSGIVVGFILQFGSGQYLAYLEKNQDLLDPTKSNEHKPVIVKPDKKIKLLDKIWILRNIRKLRGGFMDVPQILTLLQLIYETGPVLGGIGGFISFISLVPKAKLVSSLYQNSVQNLPIKSLISIEDKMTAIETVSEIGEDNIGAIVNILNDDSVPLQRKKEIVNNILNKLSNRRVSILKFILFMVALLLALYFLNTAAYLFLLKELYKAVKDGRLPKEVFQRIFGKLINKALFVAPCQFD